MKKKVKESILKVKRLFLGAAIYLLLPIQVFASEPNIVTGTRSLVASAIGILTGLVVSVITFNGLKVGTQWINASPEEKPKFQKELINVVIAGVVTLTIGGTVAWIVNFYQG